MHRLAVVVTVIAPLALAGCADPGTPLSRSPDPGEARVAGDVAPATAEPLAEVATEIPNHHVQLLEISRVGRGMLEVRFALVNLATDGEPTEMAGLFASAPGDAGSVADAFIVEPVMEKKYFVLRDAQDRPICSRDLSALAPGGRVEIWARFPVPTGDVTEIELHIPHAPAFRSLALPPASAPAD